MKKSWISFLNEIQKEVKRIKLTSENVCFRGQADSSWDLSPTLFVKQKEKKISKKDIDRTEAAIYFDFVTNAGNLLPQQIKDWEILFQMRHHGIPTRLLDWTESFANALYFALYGNGNTPSIWIMDCYALNEKTYGEAAIPNPLTDLEFSYNDAFIDKTHKGYNETIAIIPPRSSSRIFAQKGLFVLQGHDDTPMNLHPKTKRFFKQFKIPKDAISEALMFLDLAGVNHYSVFPDLDGLGKYLNQLHKLD